MAWGFQSWDDAGNLTMGPDLRNGLFKGSFSVLSNAASGSFQDASLAGKAVFWIPQFSAQPTGSYLEQAVNYNAATGTWSWGGPTQVGFTIYYGAR
ncbi:hypothetical protein [uncultured Brevundimonas sp.]|uniref:hypothetical protein n=1 Tax=uncultured Brevundimonas sp. TaxID=213418 RepID=UPI0025F6B385|nr:hypothetical protein [uncultured Brevundimonas sp.]